jgi:hypothetical protein
LGISRGGSLGSAGKDIGFTIGSVVVVVADRTFDEKKSDKHPNTACDNRPYPSTTIFPCPLLQEFSLQYVFLVSSNTILTYSIER